MVIHDWSIDKRGKLAQGDVSVDEGRSANKDRHS